MPLYDYQCDTCGHRFEVRQGIREDALTSCPQCGSPIRRIIYPVGIVFKGSGFYINDSRNASSTTQPAKDSADGAGNDTKADKADKKEGSANGSTEAAPAAASGDKVAAATAAGGDGAKSANSSSTSSGKGSSSSSSPSS